MRSRWEEKYTEPTDEPVTLTESQLKALKRGAAIGMAAAILAIVAVGIAGYSLVSARSIGSDAVASKSSADETAQPAPEAAAPAAAAPTTAPAVQPAAATAPAAQPAAQSAAAAPAPKPVQETETPKMARVSAKKASTRTHRISRIEEKPVTIPAASPEPAPAVETARAKAPSLTPVAPQPVAAEAPKPVAATPKAAAHDSSAAH
ncbi:MAG TPA: hypothetical protein VE326_05585 [Candidatus Binatia bacterium]|nr:hypothetical protein [Candidatus Binatia bacterium]